MSNLRTVASMKPLITLCRACGEIPIEHDGRAARPKVTCSDKCDRIWRSARARASRSKLKAIRYLQQALESLEGIRPSVANETIQSALIQLSFIRPAELALPPLQGELDLPPVDPEPAGLQ